MPLLIASSCFDCLSAGTRETDSASYPQSVADGQSSSSTWHCEERTLREMGTFAMNARRNVCAPASGWRGRGDFFGGNRCRPWGKRSLLRSTLTRKRSAALPVQEGARS